jgi:hypothetical protein
VKSSVAVMKRMHVVAAFATANADPIYQALGTSASTTARVVVPTPQAKSK